MAIRAFIASGLMLAAIGGCTDPEERQPTAEELKRFTAQIDRAEAVAKEKAIRESRAKEQALNQKHLERVPAQN